MSHQDQPCPLVINPHTIKQVIDGLRAPAVFASLTGGSQATWKPRLWAAAAVVWATSELSTLPARFVQGRKISTKVFRWCPAPGGSYQGVYEDAGPMAGRAAGRRGAAAADPEAGGAAGAVGDGGLWSVCRGRQPGGAGRERVVGSRLCAGAPAPQSPAAQTDGGAAIPQETSGSGTTEKSHLPAAVADAVRACRQRLTVGVADGSVGGQ